MKAIKAVVENGQVSLSEPLGDKGRFDAIVVLMDQDPWDAIIADPRPRPALAKAREQALADYAAGRTEPIDPDRMR